jgi:hypothetical protein
MFQLTIFPRKDALIIFYPHCKFLLGDLGGLFNTSKSYQLTANG